MIHLLAYGNSIYLTGVSSQLNADPEIEIHSAAALTDLGSLCQFNVVLVDLNDTAVRDMQRLPCARPNLRIFGLNAADGTLVDINRQVYVTSTLQDIIDRIKNESR